MSFFDVNAKIANKPKEIMIKKGGRSGKNSAPEKPFYFDKYLKGVLGTDKLQHITLLEYRNDL